MVCVCVRVCVCVHLGGCALALVHIDDDKAVNARHIHLYPPCPPRVQQPFPGEVLIQVGGALLFSLPLLPSLSPISDSRITCRQKPLLTVPLHTSAQAA